MTTTTTPTTEALTLRDPVGTKEIAERLHTKRATVYSWCGRRPERDPMPEPDTHISGTPVWQWHRVQAWAIMTGRLPQSGSWDQPPTRAAIEDQRDLAGATVAGDGIDWSSDNETHKKGAK